MPSLRPWLPLVLALCLPLAVGCRPALSDTPPPDDTGDDDGPRDDDWLTEDIWNISNLSASNNCASSLTRNSLDPGVQPRHVDGDLWELDWILEPGALTANVTSTEASFTGDTELQIAGCLLTHDVVLTLAPLESDNLAVYIRIDISTNGDEDCPIVLPLFDFEDMPCWYEGDGELWVYPQ